MNLSIEKIKIWATDEATFRRGKSYFDNGHVRRMRMLSENESITVRADVTGTYFSHYQVELILGESAGLKSANCACPAFAQYEGLCKHCVAVLLAARGGLNTGAVREKHVPRSGAGVRKLIDDYARVADGGAEADLEGQVRLEAELSFRGTPAMAYVSLKVGTARLYVVRAVRDFLDALHRGSHVEYGKGLAFTHTFDAFEQRSRAFALMLAERDEECEAYTRLKNAYYLQDKRLRGLSPAALDDLFGMFEKTRLHVSERGDLLLRKDDPVIGIAARRLVNGEVEMTTKDVLLARMPGHLYIAAGDNLYQTSLGMARAMGGLLALLEQSKRRLILAGRDVDAFCADVLPVIRPYIALDGEAAFEGHAPETLEPRVYIDLPERDLLTCRPVAAYEHDELDLFRDEMGGHARDRRAEHAFIRALGRMFGVPENGTYTVAGEEKIADLLDEGIPALQKISDVQVSDRVRRLSFAPSKRPTVEVSLNSGILDLNFDLGEFPKEELSQALDAYREKRRYYRLQDGRFVRFEGSAFGDMARLTDGLMLTGKQIAEGKAAIPAFRAMYLDGLFKSDGKIAVRRDAAFRALVNAIAEASDADHPVPSDFNGALRPYQEAGFRWMRTLADSALCGILADDMGLGKTIQFIALLLSDGADRPSLIACPASVTLNWESEIHLFAPTLPVLVLSGTAAQRQAQIKSLSGRGVAITSYDLLKRDVEAYQSVRFRYFAIDEAQYIKNRATKNAQAAKRIVSQYRFALTGTPIENRLSELWSIFDFLMPGYLYSYARFRERFETPIAKNDDADARADLKRFIAPFILRRLKKDVLSELPPKVTTISTVLLEGEQRKVYEAYAMKAAGELDELDGNAPNERRMKVFAMLTRLRQLCCDPNLCLENYEGPSAKLEACMDLLAEAIDGGHKVLLFSQFTSMLDIIKKQLLKDGISFFALTGDTPKEERLALVNRFNADDTGVFLISLKAGGTGLNLTGADTVIHYDPWWNTAAQDQATDRAHRIGQEKSVMVYKLIAKNTVEEKILALQKRKGELADVIEGEGASLSEMTKDELMDLFSAR